MSSRLKVIVIGLTLVVIAMAVAKVLPGPWQGDKALAETGTSPSAEARGQEPLRKITCVRGVAQAGLRAGAIDISVACAPRGNQGRVAFSLATYAAGKEKRASKISSFRRRPLLLGAGSGNKFGSCQLHSDVLDCEAIAHRSLRVEGRIWVKAPQRCDSGIAIFVARPAECGSEGCHPVLIVKNLYRGLPRGC